jgi:hypothetical protein
MISIEHEQSGAGAIVYRIKLFEPGLEKKGRVFDAHSIAGVHLAIDHYFGLNNHSSFSCKEGCPLCRG